MYGGIEPSAPTKRQQFLFGKKLQPANFPRQSLALRSTFRSRTQAWRFMGPSEYSSTSPEQLAAVPQRFPWAKETHRRAAPPPLLRRKLFPRTRIPPGGNPLVTHPFHHGEEIT